MSATFLSVLLAAAAPLSAEADDAALVRLVGAFQAAERAYDPAALARLTTDDYIEISPLGEVDARERFLGFYAPDKKQPAPEIVVSERTVRRVGGMGLVTMRLAYGSAAMRAVYVARRHAGGWALASAQFTPIRPPRAP